MGRAHRNGDTFPRLADPLGYYDKDDILHAVKAIVATQRDYGRRDDRKQVRPRFVRPAFLHATAPSLQAVYDLQTYALFLSAFYTLLVRTITDEMVSPRPLSPVAMHFTNVSSSSSHRAGADEVPGARVGRAEVPLGGRAVFRQEVQALQVRRLVVQLAVVGLGLPPTTETSRRVHRDITSTMIGVSDILAVLRFMCSQPESARYAASGCRRHTLIIGAQDLALAHALAPAPAPDLIEPSTLDPNAKP